MGNNLTSSLLFDPPLPPTPLGPPHNPHQKYFWIETNSNSSNHESGGYGSGGSDSESPPILIPAIFISHPNAKFTILYSHGHDVDLGLIYDFLVDLSRLLQVNVMSYDYGGYGLGRKIDLVYNANNNSRSNSSSDNKDCRGNGNVGSNGEKASKIFQRKKKLRNKQTEKSKNNNIDKYDRYNTYHSSDEESDDELSDDGTLSTTGEGSILEDREAREARAKRERKDARESSDPLGKIVDPLLDPLENFLNLEKTGTNQDGGYPNEGDKYENHHDDSFLQKVKQGKEVTPSEEQCYADIQACHNYLVYNKGIPPAYIILYGKSLGSGPTCWLAQKLSLRFRAKKMDKLMDSSVDAGSSLVVDVAELPFGGVILHSAFLSVMRIMANMGGFFSPPLDSFPNIDRITDIEGPTYIIHGKEDEVIPFSHGKELHRLRTQATQQSKGSSKKSTKPSFPPFWADEASHSNIESKYATAYVKRLQQFVRHVDLRIGKLCNLPVTYGVTNNNNSNANSSSKVGIADNNIMLKGGAADGLKDKYVRERCLTLEKRRSGSNMNDVNNDNTGGIMGKRVGEDEVDVNAAYSHYGKNGSSSAIANAGVSGNTNLKKSKSPKSVSKSSKSSKSGKSSKSSSSKGSTSSKSSPKSSPKVINTGKKLQSTTNTYNSQRQTNAISNKPQHTASSSRGREVGRSASRGRTRSKTPSRMRSRSRGDAGNTENKEAARNANPGQSGNGRGREVGVTGSTDGGGNGAAGRSRGRSRENRNLALTPEDIRRARSNSRARQRKKKGTLVMRGGTDLSDDEYQDYQDVVPSRSSGPSGHQDDLSGQANYSHQNNYSRHHYPGQKQHSQQHGQQSQVVHHRQPHSNSMQHVHSPQHHYHATESNANDGNTVATSESDYYDGFVYKKHLKGVPRGGGGAVGTVGAGSRCTRAAHTVHATQATHGARGNGRMARESRNPSQ